MVASWSHEISIHDDDFPHLQLMFKLELFAQLCLFSRFSGVFARLGEDDMNL